MNTFLELQQIFRAYLEDNKFTKPPEKLYTPVDYIMGLGGKRLRPILVLMSTQMFQKDLERALPIALAVETFHNFSLVHDDIMDEAPLRRGQATVHQKYNTNTGILSGDVMLIYAYKYLSKGDNSIKIAQLVHAFNRIAIEVCEGQQYDMNFEEQEDVTIDAYLKMIELKTAALIGGSLELGAIVANASAQDIDELNQFGRNIGIAFQLQDDYLDTFGDPQKFGKKVGGDIIQNKKTFLLLKALELASSPVKQKLINAMQSTQLSEKEKVKTVTEIFWDLEIPRQAEQIKQYFQHKAFEHLDKVKVPKIRKQSLIDLSIKLLEREE